MTTSTGASRSPAYSDKDLARFWSKVDRRGPDDCWPWLGLTVPDGYGSFRVAGAFALAHRFSFQVTFGPIPDGMDLDHLCHSRDTSACSDLELCPHRACVNPAHLEPVTHRVNVLRGLSFSAINAAKDKCAAGHPFDAANTYTQGGTRRQCRRCNRAAVDRYQARNGRRRPREQR